MQVKKIIVKNFLNPGEQKFVFNEDQVLTRGIFHNPNEIPMINDLLNGSWIESTLSFEKYYPKFAKKLKDKDMDFQIDALFYLESEELEQLNTILNGLGVLKPYKSRAYYYSIKCIYPFIFPIVSLKPAEFTDETPIGIGNHYEKFFKSSLNKRDILTVMGISAVGRIRDRYFEYKNLNVREDQKVIYRRYLDVIKSTYRYDEEFIKKLGQAIYNIDDGDIINYADEVEFFLRNDSFNNFLETIPLLKEDEMLKNDFAKLIFDVYLVDLKWIYSVRTSNDIVEIRKNLFENYCEKALFSKELLNFFNTKLTVDKKLFDYSVSINHFSNNLDETIVYKGEPQFEKIFEKGAIEPKFVEVKDTKKINNKKIKTLKENLKKTKEQEKKAEKVKKEKVKKVMKDTKKTKKKIEKESKIKKIDK
ncbi:hypothetical protein [Spiroplasma monobiae]|uniref:Uncharacterized protein n=1 Tax=Spiroplasma monobiae MQ-1 TaxID=1336748 RepID=A0A2K9LUC1_SPISQ|nr:hypothetical protein [Spiroplasma monobiae]AUM62620.1 hypothetical protein SMONO_v1c03710 [Spiroplasma monobiae MQ-1]